MNSMVKIALLILVIAYVVSPIDLCPGPIDDALLLVMSAAGGFLSLKAED